MLRALLDLLLGPRCVLCGQRVFPRDQQGHHDQEHAYL